MKKCLDDLLGTSDVADVLGWSVKKVSAYSSAGKDGFPKPIGTIGKRPVWYRDDIIRYQEKRKREKKREKRDDKDK